MRVLVLTATFPPLSSGGADYAFRLCQQLSERGIEVHVLTNKQATAIDTVKLRTYPLMDKWSWSELPRLLRTIKQINPDVINLHFGGILYNNQPMIGFSCTLAKWIIPSVRFVTLIEAAIGLRAYLCSFPVRTIHKFMVALMRCEYSYGTILSASDALIVLSELHRKTLAFYDSSILCKSYVLPVPPLIKIPDSPAAREQGRKKLDVGTDQLLIAYFGYLYPEKGLETLLQAFKLVLKQKKDARLVIIGGTPEIVLASMDRPQYRQELLTLAEELGISQYIIWTGEYATDSEDPSLYLSASDLAVLPFDQGVFASNSSFAACAAHRLPIITTKGASLEPQFVDKENLVLVPPKDPEQLAHAIVTTLADARLLKTISDGSYALAQKFSSWQRTTEQTISIFRGENAPNLI
jgi:polysaccharide biosynthesis protein PslF